MEILEAALKADALPASKPSDDQETSRGENPIRDGEPQSSPAEEKESSQIEATSRPNVPLDDDNSSSSNGSGSSSDKQPPNSFTLVSQLADTLSPNISAEQNRRNWHNISNHSDAAGSLSPSSSSPGSSSSSSDCLPSPPGSKMAATAAVNVSTSEANPRKESPVPVAQVLDNYLDLLETSSIEHLSQLSSLQTTRAASFLMPRANVSPAPQPQPSDEPGVELRVDNRGGSGNSAGQHKSVKIESFMDKWYKEMKGQILIEVSKVQSLREQQKKLTEEKEKQAAEIKRLRQEIEFQKEKVRAHERNEAKKDENIEGLTRALEKQREKNDVQRCMLEWKVSQLESSKEAFMCKIAENFSQNRLKRKWFFHWKLQLLEWQKQKIERACKKKAEDVCLDIATRYETRIKKMEEERVKIEDELRLSRLENDRYRVELARSEENMRKALMRGVCALNLEAMSIFSENLVPPVGSNSAPASEPTVYHHQPSSENVSRRKVTSSRSGMVSRDRERDVLARKVRQFCDVQFEYDEAANEVRADPLAPPITSEAILAAVTESASKNKLKFISDSKINTNNPKINRVSENFKSTSEGTEPPATKISSSIKDFDELIDHSLPIPTKPTPKNSMVRSKIDSLPNSSRSERIMNMTSSRLGSVQIPPKAFQQRVIIEKHKTSNDVRTLGGQVARNASASRSTESRFATPLSSFK